MGIKISLITSSQKQNPVIIVHNSIVYYLPFSTSSVVPRVVSFTVNIFSFQSGVCPICLESEGESLPCCKAKIHRNCLQDWLWTGASTRCPCCNQTLPQRLVQSLLVERFERVPDMKTTFINVSPKHSFQNPQ